MKIYAVISLSTLALLAASSLVMSVPVYAEVISGAITLKVTKQEVLPVTSQSGDMLMLVETHGTNKSTNWMDDAQVVNKEIDFLLQGLQPARHVEPGAGDLASEIFQAGLQPRESRRLAARRQ